MLSQMKAIRAGVPQGSILAPLLYNIYTADIPRAANIMLAIYADDTAVFSNNQNYRYATIALQRHLNSLNQWYFTWKLKVNHTKSQCTVFKRSKGRNICSKITMDGQQLQYTDCVKYLGLYMDRNLNWHHHIDELHTVENQGIWEHSSKTKVHDLLAAHQRLYHIWIELLVSCESLSN